MLNEEDKPYKVVTYTDHKMDSLIRWFDTYEEALNCWKNRILSQNLNARFTATAALIRASDGEPLHRQTWRVG